MAKSPNSKSKPQLFLCCFGFSGKLRRFKSLKPAAGHRKRPFSLTRFHSNKTPTVQPSFPAEMNPSRPDSHRFSSKSIDSIVTCESSIEGFAVAVPVATNRPGVEMIMRPDQEVKKEVVAEKTIFEGSSSPKKAAKTNQSQSGFSLTRKLESFRSGRFTQTTSKNMKSDNNVQTPGISHSLSFPPPKPSRMNRVNEPSESGLTLKSGGERRNRHRWAVGMSIVMMTLAIMVVWGRFCAILCTASWIFIVTTLTSIVEEHDTVDFLQSGSNSEGLQNKFVLLKGFLYSNRREHLIKQL